MCENNDVTALRARRLMRIRRVFGPGVAVHFVPSRPRPRGRTHARGQGTGSRLSAPPALPCSAVLVAGHGLGLLCARTPRSRPRAGPRPRESRRRRAGPFQEDEDGSRVTTKMSLFSIHAVPVPSSAAGIRRLLKEAILPTAWTKGPLSPHRLARLAPGLGARASSASCSPWAGELGSLWGDKLHSSENNEGAHTWLTPRPDVPALSEEKTQHPESGRLWKGSRERGRLDFTMSAASDVSRPGEPSPMCF